MNIAAPFIKRPVMSTLLMIALIIIGISSYRTLPVSALPDVDFPVISVSATLAGASPEVMANTVTQPLEKQFMAIPGISSITSSSSLGSTSISLQFDLDKSVEIAAQDVESAISLAQKSLPTNMLQNPTYKKVNPSEAPILYLALTSATHTIAQLYDYANDTIGQRISMFNGVAEVTVYGSPYATRIQIDPYKLTALGLSLQDVASAVGASNPNLSTGKMDGRQKTLTIIEKNKLTEAQDFQTIPIAYNNAAPIYLQDVGHAVDSTLNPYTVVSYIEQKVSQPAVVLAVQRQPGSNTVAVCEHIRKFLPQLLQQLPSDIELKILNDRSLSVKESLQEVRFTLILSIILVVMVIFLSLGKIDETLIPALAIPFSFLCVFIAMQWLDYSLDNLSLMALTVATGFVVDDAIVVVENIARRIEEGKTPWNAAMEGSKQISTTIVSMTIALIAVFVPLLFMGGLIGRIFREFSVTLMLAVVASGVVSLTFTPMLASRLIFNYHPTFLKNLVQKISSANTAAVNLYRKGLSIAFLYPKTVLMTGVGCIVLSFILFQILPKDFLPNEDMGFVIGATAASEETSSQKMAQYHNQIIQTLEHNLDIAAMVSVVSPSQPYKGVVLLALTPKQERPDIDTVLQTLHAQLVSLVGVNTYIKGVPLINLSKGTGSSAADYQYSLQGFDRDKLYKSATSLLTKLKALPFLQDVNSDLEMKNLQIQFDVQMDHAISLGITTQQIEQALALAYAGGAVAQLITDIDQYNIVVEVDPKYQQGAGDLSSIYVKSSSSGKMVPLTAVMQWKECIGPAMINHIDQLPSVMISFNIVPGTTIGDALPQIEAIAKETLPDDVQGKMQGSAQAFVESMQNMALLLLAAVLVSYLVLGILYESFVHALTILSTLPPAAVGGLLALKLFHQPLSMYGYLGILLLVGIVKKNGIILVDYALEQIREKNLTAKEAIFEACLIRFRPILMTTLAAIMGALPIAIGIGYGASSHRPLGIVMVGGLLMSQLITLFLTPVLYLYMQKWHEKLSFKKEDH